jgi:hypothetical protein
MFCPECKAEYLQGVTRCSDCDVDLVETLSPSDGWETIKRVWSGKDEKWCVTLCKRLSAVGIPYKVDQRRRQYLQDVEERYTIGVLPEFFDDARKIIVKGRLDATDGGEDE